MRLIYLLVDFENLQPTAQEFALIRGDQYRLWIFRGPHQNKYDAAMAEAWQPLGDRVKFVQSTKAGKNALDFHIAFCMGGLLHEHVADVPPGFRATVKLVESVSEGEDGHEEAALHRRWHGRLPGPLWTMEV